MPLAPTSEQRCNNIARGPDRKNCLAGLELNAIAFEGFGCIIYVEIEKARCHKKFAPPKVLVGNSRGAKQDEFRKGITQQIRESKKS